LRRPLLRALRLRQGQSFARFFRREAGRARALTQSGGRCAAVTRAVPVASSSFSLARGDAAIVSLDDAGHEFVADDILMCERYMTDAFNAFQQFDGFRKAGSLAVRQVDLAWISRDDHAAVFTQPREKHFHLHGGRVLRLVQNDGAVRERSPANKSKRCDFNFTGLQRPLDDARVHQVIERVVDWAQIGIDFFAHVAGKKAKTLASFDRRARQNDTVNFFTLEHLKCLRNGEPGLARAGRPGSEHQCVALERPDIGILRGRARTYRPLTQVDLFECRPRRGKVVVEQRALRDRLTDGPFDVALAQVAATLELLIKSLENVTRLFARAARAFDRDVIASLLGDHTEATLDQRKILSVLSEQH